MALDCEARMDHLQREHSVDETHVNIQEASSKDKFGCLGSCASSFGGSKSLEKSFVLSTLTYKKMATLEDPGGHHLVGSCYSSSYIVSGSSSLPKRKILTGPAI